MSSCAELLLDLIGFFVVVEAADSSERVSDAVSSVVEARRPLVVGRFSSAGGSSFGAEECRDRVLAGSGFVSGSSLVIEAAEKNIGFY